MHFTLIHLHYSFRMTTAQREVKAVVRCIINQCDIQRTVSTTFHSFILSVRWKHSRLMV
jgi:hypothetical protein